MLSEFDLIHRYFSGWESYSDGVLLGVGDDCALLKPAAGTVLAVSTDTMVAGVHFFADTAAAIIGYRALAVSVSDLAAMGAAPMAFTLSLTLPNADEIWLEAFSRGLRLAAAAFGISLVGGDTTRGPLTIGVQVIGTNPSGESLTRRGAKPEQLICVSGSLGDAGAGLRQADSLMDRSRLSLEMLRQAPDSLLARFLCPTPRLALGQLLRHYASACIDISDGLVADLAHIMKASGVAAIVESDRLPLSAALRQFNPPDITRLALAAGDDYELCFTIAASRWQALQADENFIRLSASVPVTVVGKVVAGSGVVVTGVTNAQGDCLQGDCLQGECLAPVTGYQHFAPGDINDPDQ
jgi:thiamine-monophosphate kinase